MPDELDHARVDPAGRRGPFLEILDGHPFDQRLLPVAVPPVRQVPSGPDGRPGRAGVAVTLITPSEILKLRDVERHAHTHIEPATLDEDFPARVVSAQA